MIRGKGLSKYKFIFTQNLKAQGTKEMEVNENLTWNPKW